MPAADILLKEPIPWVPGLEGSYPGEESYVELGEARVRMVFCWCPPWDGKAAFNPWKGPGFWLAKYPVTQEQWVAVMGSNPSHFKLGGTHPVDSVSWNDAEDFCTRARMRLPLAEEWEYGCMGPNWGTLFGVGRGDTLTSQMANFDGGHPSNIGGTAVRWLRREQTIPSGSFPPNDWGLHDMHGQLFEWCKTRSWSHGSEIRGGSWMDYGAFLSLYPPFQAKPNARFDRVGFRSALGAGPSGQTIAAT